MQGLDVLYQGHNHVGANLLNCLILFPYMKNRTGIGKKATVKKPRRLVAHGTPKLWYICAANMGNPPPANDRRRLLAAIALFAYIR